MNEAAAADVLLLRAFETTGSVPWSDAERDALSRGALQAVGGDAPAEVFVAARARAGLQRLAAHDALLARWRGLRPWRAAASGVTVVIGFVAGIAVDRVGGAQHINLLAPPVWAVLAWNLAVYVALAIGAMRAPAAVGALRRVLAGAWRRWPARGWGSAGAAHAPAWQRFSADWADASLPLHSARIATALHLGAAALALGLMAGMYLRGLVLDYRVGWQSTFLDAAAVQRLLAVGLQPASALSGIVLPDVAGVQALRLPPPGGPASPAAAASAAPWIHLYALQLLLWVVLPRLALALLTGQRARRLSRHFPLPLDEPYFQRLLRRPHDAALAVQVWPHARGPDARALDALRRLVHGAFGAGATLRLAPTVAYGAEDEPVDAADRAANRANNRAGLRPEGAGSGRADDRAVEPADGGAADMRAADGTSAVLRLVLCDLGATPEPESQGRLLRALARRGAARPWLLLDEAAFVRRFGVASPRVEERRQAWRALAAAEAAGVVFADLQGDDLSAAVRALREA